MAALATEAKPRQLQVSRILQEEEESWISGEELHTDGSSDDDGGKFHHLHQHHLHHHALQSALTKSPLAGGVSGCPVGPQPPPLTASEPALQVAPHLTETSRRLSELCVAGVVGPPGVVVPPGDASHHSDDSVEEQEDIILWRPKRGSMKLPRVGLCSQSPAGASGSSSSASTAAAALPLPSESEVPSTESETTAAAAATLPPAATKLNVTEHGQCPETLPSSAPATSSATVGPAGQTCREDTPTTPKLEDSPSKKDAILPTKLGQRPLSSGEAAHRGT